MLVQAKHWLTKSVSHHEISQAVTTAEGWTPSFDVVIVATSGRFTTEAVNWADKRSTAGRRPDVELWPDSELEALPRPTPGNRHRARAHEPRTRSPALHSRVAAARASARLRSPDSAYRGMDSIRSSPSAPSAILIGRFAESGSS